MTALVPAKERCPQYRSQWKQMLYKGMENMSPFWCKYAHRMKDYYFLEYSLDGKSSFFERKLLVGVWDRNRPWLISVGLPGSKGEIFLFYSRGERIDLVVQWLRLLRLCTSTAGSRVSIPAWRTKIPRATCVAKKIKNKMREGRWMKLGGKSHALWYDPAQGLSEGAINSINKKINKWLTIVQ